jgi:N-acetylglucosaminyldiphosphoundecaprenol N-acetyl-beta-D-mannosaminyltransferase
MGSPEEKGTRSTREHAGAVRATVLEDLTFPSVSVLGFRLDLPSLEQAARWVMNTAEPRTLEECASLQERFPRPDAAASAGGSTSLAISFNPELVMAALENPVAAEALHNADLTYPDGVGAVWAARRRLALDPATDPGPRRVAGIDLAQRVLELAAGAGTPVYLLGAGPGVAEEAAGRQRAWLPGLQIAGWRDGYFSPADEEAVVGVVRASGAAILLVAMGAPKQEMLLHRHRDEWGAAVALGVGGSFDVWAGRAVRAPEWVRRAGVEWLYRLAREPKRVRRQLVLPRYVARVLRAPSEIAVDRQRGDDA